MSFNGDELLRELRNETGKAPSYLLFLVITIISALLLWSAYTELDIVVRGEGKTLSESTNQVLQTPESGVIIEKFVDEGELVKPGQKLFLLDLVEIKGQLSQLQDRLKLLEIRKLRLNAESRNQNFTEEYLSEVHKEEFFNNELSLHLAQKDQLLNSIETIKLKKEQKEKEIESLLVELSSAGRSITLLQSEIDAVEPLVSKNLVPETRLIALKRELENLQGKSESIPITIDAVETSVFELQNLIEQEKINFQTRALSELSQVTLEIADISSKVPNLKTRLDRAEIRSPISGIMNSITLESSDAFVRSGDVVAEIVPVNDGLIVEGKIDPKDIAKVAVNDRVKVSLTAYDASKYGRIDGIVKTVSADAFTDKQSNAQYYQVEIKLQDVYTDDKGNSMLVIPGMVATIEILSGRRTIFDYFWAPLVKAKDNAFKE